MQAVCVAMEGLVSPPMVLEWMLVAAACMDEHMQTFVSLGRIRRGMHMGKLTFSSHRYCKHFEGSPRG